MDVAAVVSLAFVASITPGPNNLMLWASGMNHGIRRTVPHVAGISLGFALLLFLTALGLGAVFERYDAIALALKLLGGGYLLYLAYKIASTTSIGATSNDSRPMSFIEAAAFQWMNPKAWVMSTTASTTLLNTETTVLGAAASLTALFWIVALPSSFTWLLFGATASRWVDNETRVRNVNRTLGALLAATVVLLLT